MSFTVTGDDLELGWFGIEADVDHLLELGIPFIIFGVIDICKIVFSEESFVTDLVSEHLRFSDAVFIVLERARANVHADMSNTSNECRIDAILPDVEEEFLGEVVEDVVHGQMLGTVVEPNVGKDLLLLRIVAHVDVVPALESIGI